MALGWGLNTTPLPAAIIPIELQMTVSEGLVEGVMLPTTPKGAISVSVSPQSPVLTAETMSSVPGVLSATRRCFAVLWSTRPILVSATPIFAMMGASARQKSRMEVMSFSRSSTRISRIAR